MGYTTKVQVIKHDLYHQYYISLPAALTRELEINQSETVEWILADKKHLILVRNDIPDNRAQEKKRNQLLRY